VVQNLARHSYKLPKPRARTLNERENRIIELVAAGLTNYEIAQEIGRTFHMVKNYLCVIYDKLGVWNRVELALWWEAKQEKERTL
jgi:DNA-binding NarL/FixJ family response regulator